MRINKLTFSEIIKTKSLREYPMTNITILAYFITKIKFQNKLNLYNFNYSENINMEFNKKRKRLEETEKQTKENAELKKNDTNNDSFEVYENGLKRLNLPKKSNYRMRAHCNPLAGVSIA